MIIKGKKIIKEIKKCIVFIGSIVTKAYREVIDYIRDKNGVGKKC